MPENHFFRINRCSTYRQEAGILFWWCLGWSKPEAEPGGTILFVAVSAAPGKLATDWAEDCDEIILRRCPIRERDSIIGLGRRRKQAHNEHHDWIWIHRGHCGR
jgi:hypothetical protein